MLENTNLIVSFKFILKNISKINYRIATMKFKLKLQLNSKEIIL